MFYLAHIGLQRVASTASRGELVALPRLRLSLTRMPSVFARSRLVSSEFVVNLREDTWNTCSVCVFCLYSVCILCVFLSVLSRMVYQVLYSVRSMYKEYIHACRIPYISVCIQRIPEVGPRIHQNTYRIRHRIHRIQKNRKRHHF